MPKRKPKPPARELSAEQIADATGRKPRAVQLWAREGCPHSPGPRFKLDEVHRWLDSVGRDRVAASRSRPKRKPAEPEPADTKPEKPAKPKLAEPKPAEPEPAKLIAPDIAKTGDEAFDFVVEQQYTQLVNYLEKAPAGEDATVGNRDRYASGLGKLSGEYRKLINQRAQVVELSRNWISKRGVIAVLSAQGAAMTLRLSSLRTDLPASIIEDLVAQGVVKETDAERVEGILAAATSRVVDEASESAEQQFAHNMKSINP